jgi:hypothetical protein
MPLRPEEWRDVRPAHRSFPPSLRWASEVHRSTGGQTRSSASLPLSQRAVRVTLPTTTMLLQRLAFVYKFVRFLRLPWSQGHF